MAVLTGKYYVNVIQNLIDDLTDSKNNYYVFVARSYPWPDDNNPPIAVNTYEEYEQSIYHDMVYGKLIDKSALSFVIPRYNWTPNTVYNEYNQTDANLFNENFYVINDSNQVYKCIDNNNNSPSLIKPFLTSPAGTFTTGDGYTWKYMFTVDATNMSDFGTSSYIPVVPNANVAIASIPGTIDKINVTQAGSNYQTYTEGLLQSFVDEYSVQIANTSSDYDNFYANSSIYLKGGLGSGQIRQIKSYSGESNLLTVYEPFDLFVTLNVANVQGTVIVGQEVEQRTDVIAYLYQNGYFNPNDIIQQTDTGAMGSIITANTAVMNIFKTSNANFTVSQYVNNVPVFNTSQGGVLKTGTVSVTVGNNYVTAVTGTAFTTDYAVNQYIRVGPNANNNVRRITAVNSTVLTVSVPFYNNLSGVAHYTAPYAVEPTSLTVIDSTGTITSVNLTSLKLSYDTTSSSDISYIIGEQVKLQSLAGIDQLANATINFVNSSVVILNNVQGSFAANLYMVGQSSTLSSRIASINSYPNITIAAANRQYISGQPFNILSSNGQITGNATLLTSTSTPDNLTEYIISPTVEIVGDGTGALAYCTCNTNVQSAYEIDNIVMINNGTGYTYANVSIVANSLYGQNAIVTPVISPILGHGFDPYTELGAQYLAVSMLFDTAANELYKFPAYGQYRRVGIIKNPSFNDVYINVNGFSQITLQLANKSSNTFSVGEYVVQANSSACGQVVSANSSYMQLGSVQGTFVANVAGDNVQGLTTGTTANAKAANVNYFSISANVESVSDGTSWANGNIIQIIDTNDIRLSNVTGIISKGDVLIDYISNTYATVNAISVSNGTVDVTPNFGVRFNQTARISLSSNSGSFSNTEYIYQDTTNASGRVISDSDELDFIYTSVSGVFSAGLTITNANTNANGVITFANSTYIKVVTSDKQWFLSDPIKTNSANGIITGIYNVLRLNDVDGTFQSMDLITGNTSGAVGYCNFQHTIEYPDLIKNTGEVIYINDISPIQKSLSSKEAVNLVLKF